MVIINTAQHIHRYNIVKEDVNQGVKTNIRTKTTDNDNNDVIMRHYHMIETYFSFYI
jgi:hypothetical protein